MKKQENKKVLDDEVPSRFNGKGKVEVNDGQETPAKQKRKDKKERQKQIRNIKKKSHESLDKLEKKHSEEEYRQHLKSIITTTDYSDVKYWKKVIKQRLFARVAIIVNMEMSNGNMRTFLQVLQPDNTFTFKGKQYVFDIEARYYNLDLQMHCVDYHEELAIPIKRHVPVSTIWETLEDLSEDVQYSYNPLTLKQFVIAKIAEGVMKGQAISEYLRRYGVLITIILVVVIAHFLIWAYRTGMFDQISSTVGLG